MVLTPIELLKQQKEKLLRAKQHALNSFKEKQIDEEKLKGIITNLIPKINAYDFAILNLQRYENID